MPSTRLCLLILIALSGALLPARPGAALPMPDLAPQPQSLAGHLLLASPRMGDPRFRRTAILMIRHDKTGALGVAINRPAGQQPLATLLEALGDTGVNGGGSVRLFAGGPVQPEIGFVVHSTDYERRQSIRVTPEIAVTTTQEILRDMAHGKGPQKTLIVLGYAGWGAGQLDAELAQGDWLVASADPDLVFDAPRERVWDEAMARR